MHTLTALGLCTYQGREGEGGGEGRERVDMVNICRCGCLSLKIYPNLR